MSNELFTLQWSFGVEPETDTYPSMEEALQRAQDLRRGGAATPIRILDDHGDVILSEDELNEALDEVDLYRSNMIMNP
jgi:hypothetical protein